MMSSTRMEKYLKTADTEWYNQRIFGVILCVAACFCLLAVRLFYLQIIQGEEYRRLSENNSIRLQRIEPFRGIIYDRNGTMLVDNRPSFDITVIPKNAEPLERTAGKLAHYLDEPKESLIERLQQYRGLRSFKPVVLKPDVDRDMLAAVEVHRYDLPGVEVQVKPTRNYVYNQSAAHLLGYIGEINAAELDSGRYAGLRSGDLIGKFGAERTFDRFLRGKSGGRQVEVNATGQVVRVLDTVPAEPGRNVVLSIDIRVQRKAEELLEGVTGAAVAVEPATGQILALASSPGFDQNAFVSGLTHDQWRAFTRDPQKPLTNRALQGEYPPGSTYKIITAIAGLEEGVVDENTEYFCPGHLRFARRDYRCWKRGGHGRVNLVDAIAESCDVYFYHVGLAIGVDRLAWYAKAAGLGSPTDIDLAHEAAGLIPTADWKQRRFNTAWQKGENLSIAIGQGFNLTTPLQLAMMISSVANDGIRYHPQILKEVRSAQGELIAAPEPVVAGRLPASAKTMALVQEGLRQVVNSERGTARGSMVAGLDISGKTGTSQVISRKEGEEEEETPIPDRLKAHALFVAYAPNEHPKIAVAVVVENGEHGSGAAAPIAREMIKTYLLGDPLQPKPKVVAARE